MPPRLGQTRATLLQRLASRDDAAWAEFVYLYREAIIRFCISRAVQLSDAEDVAQAVLASLSNTMARFSYDPSRGRFRDYLFRCIRSELSRIPPRPRPESHAAPLVLSEASSESALSSDWEREWVQHHFRLAMAAIHETFEPRSVEIFERSLAGVTTRNLAAEYATSEDSIHKIRQRIRTRLEELISEQVAAEEARPASESTS
jgi:RNA polymerase sigma-70 factor (ECF subfamily)